MRRARAFFPFLGGSIVAGVLAISCARSSAPPGAAPAGRPIPAAPPDDPHAFLQAFREAVGKLLEGPKAATAAVTAIERAAELAPGNDVLMYLAARTNVRAHHRETAIDWLHRMDDLGSDLVPSTKDFEEIAGDPRFAKVVAAATARAAARSAGVSEAWRIDAPGVLPEGIAFDPKTGAFFVGSIRHRMIYKVVDGRPSDFVPQSAGLHGIVGLRVDPARRLVWAAADADEDEDGYDAAQAGRGELVALDADTGAIKRRVPAPDGGKHAWNDVAIGPDGTAFVTDSELGAVFAVAPGATSAREVVPAARFIYPNGIAYDEAARALFVADVLGVWRVDPATGATTPLTFARGVPLAGLDGLYVSGKWLVGVQGIAGPGRVVAYELDEARARVVRYRVLASALPAFDVPTTGAIHDGAIYVLSNSQIKSTRPPQPIVITRVPLPR